jgi:hypothetical protein
MDGAQSLRFLSQEQLGEIVALAERARQDLSRFSGREVALAVEAAQLLDEWIEDYLEAAPDPSAKVRLLWTCLLGEMLRRCHDGWWALRDGRLVVVCPTEGGGRHVAAVREQVDRRIASGMSESLTYFYNVTRIELRMA